MVYFSAWLGANLSWILPLLLLIILGLIAVTAWLTVRLRRLEQHYRLLTAGVEGGNLQALLEQHVARVEEAARHVRELDARTQRVERAGLSHIQRLGFLRFNPFRETGGDQSFALVLADHGGNGVVISSLHSREVTRVYAKPLAAWESPYQLTAEEQQVIGQAKEGKER